MADTCEKCKLNVKKDDAIVCPCQRKFHQDCITYEYEEFFECKICLNQGICEKCLHHYTNESIINWVECDACECWFHASCINVNVDKNENWFCDKKGCQLIKKKNDNLENSKVKQKNSPQASTCFNMKSVSDTTHDNITNEATMLGFMSKLTDFLDRKSNEELPDFNGDSGKWNIFYDAYNETKHFYSDVVNSKRILKALGPQVKAEFSLHLDNPKEIDSAIIKMNEYYGAPRRVIRAVVEKVKSIQLNEMKPNTITKFARLVSSLATTLNKSDPAGIYFSNYATLDSLVMKLPWGLKKAWMEHLVTVSNDKVSISSFADWLNNKSKIYEMMDQSFIPENKMSQNVVEVRNKAKVNPHITTLDTSNNKYFKCWMHRSNRHNIRDCGLFLSKSAEDRKELLIKEQACFKCAEKHQKNNCPYKFWPMCSKCGKDHHELLHIQEEVSNNNSDPENNQKDDKRTDHTQNQGMLNNHCSLNTSINLLKMIPVQISTKTGSKTVLAFLDCGSTITLIEKSLADELNLEGPMNDLTLVWTAGAERKEDNSTVVEFKIKGVSSKAKEYTIKAHTVQNKIGINQNLNLNDLKEKYKFLRNIEIDEYPANYATILIGLDNKHLLTTQRLREGRLNEPTAELTRLGWTVYGVSENPNKNSCQTHFVGFQQVKTDENFDRLFEEYILNEKRFDENSEKEKNSDSQEIIRAKEILKSTTKFIDGRWHTGLLWKSDNVKLPDSFSMAKQRLRSVTLRAMKDGTWDTYRQLVANFIQKGYATKLTDEEINCVTDRTWILPHFLVYNPNKSTPRLVWDAAAEINGESLNKNLLVGPDLYVPLSDVIYKFREGVFAYGGDIQEMFLQIKMIKSDRDSLRFLFWDKLDGKIQTYKMTSMIFGSASSPTSAIYIRDLNAEQFMSKYPRAVTAIKQNTYVDDFLHSNYTIEESKEMLKQVREIHKAGGFSLVGLTANDNSILEGIISEEELNDNPSPKLFDKSIQARVLGLKWDKEDDTLSFSTNFPKVKKDILELTRLPTMKEVLSIEMSIFDPNQYAAHFMIGVKLILQELWNRKIEWNDTIPDDLVKDWEKWVKSIQWLKQVKIPRCYSTKLNQSESVELHIFCDASKKAYAAVAYIRVMCGSQYEVQLVAAKSKLAPRKQPRTIPELELTAAVIGIELGQRIIDGHNKIFHSVSYWTDSKIVMGWISADSSKFRLYVSNRIKKIRDKSIPTQWSWVSTNDMPADLATKWAPSERNMSINSLWFRGPEFLRRPKCEWSNNEVNTDSSGHPEINNGIYLLNVHINTNSFILPVSTERFSNWHKMVRVTAYIKFIIQCHKKKDFAEFRDIKYNKLPPPPNFLSEAEEYLYRKAQLEELSTEFKIISENKMLPKKHPLYKLNLFVDENNLLRAQGRLVNSQVMSYSAKRPILLPKNNRITKLIIIHYHESCAHQGLNTVINKLQTKFYIPSIRSTVKKTITNLCMMCKVRKVIPKAPQMGNLPDFRLAPFYPPFSYVAIDLCGPFEIVVGRSLVKRYPILFSCLTTRALHIEIASSLSADSFIMNYRNFVSLCNQPELIISDRGTNLVGAQNEIKLAFEKCNTIMLSEGRIQKPAKWEFLPAKSPHMNGAVERMVKSVKNAFNNMMDELNKKHRKLTEEAFRSLLMEIVGIINSRPLTHVSSDLEDDLPLTPNHFLMRSTEMLPLGEFSKFNLQNQWKNVQYLANLYWQKWCNSYLPTISNRSKWIEKVEPLKVGDLVVTMDQEDRGHWRRGRIERVIQGKDGQARSYEVRVINRQENKTFPGTSRIITRPAIKLGKLEV